MRIWIYIAMSVLLAMVTSCGKDADDADDTAPQSHSSQYVITYVPSIHGLGDTAFNDSCLSVIYDKVLEHNLLLEIIAPDEYIKPETAINYWWGNESNWEIHKRLLILGDAMYGDILKREGYATGVQGDIMVMDSHDWNLDAYTMYMPIYGVCYLSGLLAGNTVFFEQTNQDWEHALLMMANDQDDVLKEGADGFENGLSESCKQEPTVVTMSNEEGSGYTDYEITKIMMKLNIGSHRYILPLIGGNCRILRSEVGMEEYKTKILFTGVDCNIDNPMQMNFFCKNLQMTLGGFIDQWYAGMMPERHQLFTWRNGGINHSFAYWVYEAVRKAGLGEAYLDSLVEVSKSKEDKYYADMLY